MSDNKDVKHKNPFSKGHYAGRYSSQTPVKRKRKKTKPLFVVVVALVVILIALLLVLVFGGSKSNSELIGTWKYNQYTAYEFFEDGTGCLCVDDVHYEYKYKVSGDKLTLDFTEDVVRDCEYTFTIENRNLTLVGGEGTDKGTYKLNKVS